MLLALLIFALIASHPMVHTNAAIQVTPSKAADAGPKLDARIRRADPKQYEAVLDVRDWRNPWCRIEAVPFWKSTAALAALGAAVGRGIATAAIVATSGDASASR